MIALLSIKPEFAHLIFDGVKCYEYRRNTFKQSVTSIVVYASSPVCRVIGEFTVEQILCDNVDTIWRETCSQSGISKERFDAYFAYRNKGYAIKVGKTQKYDTPYCLKSDYGLRP